MEMSTRPVRGNHRHSLWYERILLSFRVHYLLGLTLTSLLPALWGRAWSTSTLAAISTNTTVLASAIAWMVAFRIVQQLSRHPGADPCTYVAPVVTAVYLLILVVLELMAIPFHLTQLLMSGGLALLFGWTGYRVTRRYRRLKMALVPLGNIREWFGHQDVDQRWLSGPDLESLRVDGVIIDLSCDLNDEWQRFLADCTIKRIPVHDARRFGEASTGRIGLDQIHANRYGSLMPRTSYELFKRLADILAALLMLPAALPIMAVAAMMIKRDDPGPILFRQRRSGFQGEEFDVYKMRSMYVNPDDVRPTQEGDDPRITKVGRYLRKYRIDELPQLFNVLKGEMSLIGPRPETPALTEAYERDIPFFRYRHAVRPGISGWAQVEQGYASEVEGSRIKLEYDFYYIRNFSFWMDLLVVIRTIRTIFTGSGAR
ncbi:exopolysaccharide biosynthesis polyprenyl glycosylphosphotransferase [Kushneria phyllosphaerae]|uniref:UDP-N-acetylgalactosamine-undecaprenyl-phosphate N-acetylgalactosaminephosphotransferase n=1 Tax=Kushneria phyllosphaerae TaxID=2100822 RepID=A0A2R8CIT2_9GAMM|nr:exopolysaccharide biosynthesis polyprenyl glycosylphosphotransferase [Kushneria phyllosphaerae]SPJ32809.1 UDP-N-acetylgalactosamine-undecaprenyl-phosphate N-acetylgalactosaminephosphotransferase [Kushneria phyllosphaerae]